MATICDDDDFSMVEKDTVIEHFMIEEKNCMSVPSMLVKLGGYGSFYKFISDTTMAEMIFNKGREDLKNLDLFHDVYFNKKHQSIISEAEISVVHYKRGKMSRPRLTTVAVIMIKPFFAMEWEHSNLTFVRLFHLPCKSINCTLFRKGGTFLWGRLSGT